MNNPLSGRVFECRMDYKANYGSCRNGPGISDMNKGEKCLLIDITEHMNAVVLILKTRTIDIVPLHILTMVESEMPELAKYTMENAQ